MCDAKQSLGAAALLKARQGVCPMPITASRVVLRPRAVLAVPRAPVASRAELLVMKPGFDPIVRRLCLLISTAFLSQLRSSHARGAESARLLATIS